MSDYLNISSLYSFVPDRFGQGTPYHEPFLRFRDAKLEDLQGRLGEIHEEAHERSKKDTDPHLEQIRDATAKRDDALKVISAATKERDDALKVISGSKKYRGTRNSAPSRAEGPAREGALPFY